MKARRAAAVILVGALATGNAAMAGGGPLGIDRKLTYDNQGIWKRSNQNALRGILLGGEVLGAL